MKTSCLEKETLLMIEKLREHPDNIPSPNRDEIMKMCDAVFAETLAKVDMSFELQSFLRQSQFFCLLVWHF